MKHLLRLVGVVAAGAALMLSLSYAGQHDYSYPRSTVHQIFAEENEDSSGSGVMIAPMLMLTVVHAAVVPNLTVGPKRAPVKVLRIDEEKDLALLLVPLGCPCASIATGSPEIDERVISIGFPMNGLVGVQVLTEGRYQGEKDSYMPISAPIAPGNSGGGVFVWDGMSWRLVGITHGMGVGLIGGLTPSFLPHLAFASSTASMLKFLNGRSPAEMQAVKSGRVG